MTKIQNPKEVYENEKSHLNCKSSEALCDTYCLF